MRAIASKQYLRDRPVFHLFFRIFAKKSNDRTPKIAVLDRIRNGESLRPSDS